jgi:hypothetical protein
VAQGLQCQKKGLQSFFSLSGFGGYSLLPSSKSRIKRRNIIIKNKEMIKELKYKIKFNKEYSNYKQIKKGGKPINMKRGAGYYIPSGIINVDVIGRKESIAMSSGRKAIAELISYETYFDPGDMVKESSWHISGYDGEKLFKDMSFEEYLKSAFGKTI